MIARLLPLILIGFVLGCGTATGEPDGTSDSVPATVDSLTPLPDQQSSSDTTTPSDVSPSSDQQPVLDSTVVSTSAETVLDEVYLTVNGSALKVDLRVPAGVGPFPLVLVIHGGAFYSGEKSQGNVVSWAETLTANGFVSAAVDYRLTGQFNSPPAFPGPVQDLKCAIRVLRNQAQRFRIDSSKVFVLGGSAGGYFANILGLSNGATTLEATCPGGAGQPSTVSGAVSYFGISDWTTINSQRGAQDPAPQSEVAFVGSSCDLPSDTACISASPISFADASDPPMFLLHSDDDPAIPVAQSHELRDALLALGVSVTYHEVSGKGHGWLAKFGDPEIAAARDKVLAWLKAQAGR